MLEKKVKQFYESTRNSHNYSSHTKDSWRVRTILLYQGREFSSRDWRSSFDIKRITRVLH
jgi:hypothetical protein